MLYNAWSSFGESGSPGRMNGSLDDKDLGKLVASFFLTVRLQRQCTQEEFAARLGVGVRYLQDIEYGAKVPSSIILMKCMALANDSAWAGLRSDLRPEPEPKPAAVSPLPQFQPSPA